MALIFEVVILVATRRVGAPNEIKSLKAGWGQTASVSFDFEDANGNSKAGRVDLAFGFLDTNNRSLHFDPS